METRPAAETAGLFIGSKKVEMHEHASQDAPVPNKPRSKKKGAPAKLKISSGIQVSEESIEEDIAEIDTLQEPGRAQARPQSIAAFDPMHPKCARPAEPPSKYVATKHGRRSQNVYL